MWSTCARLSDRLWIKLRKIEVQLRRELGRIRLVGQLAGSQRSYERLAHEVKAFLAGKSEKIAEVPDGLWLVLLVFYARYEYRSEQHFWANFLQRLGLTDEPKVQNACRKQFKEAQRSFGHLYFPNEGYTCVTPILYHAVIPQSCVAELANLIGDIGVGAGWETVMDLGLDELAAQLPSVVASAHATKPLSRFVISSYSRQLAAQLVHDLCEAAYLHHRGELTAQQIEYLLSDNPILREVWERMSCDSARLSNSISPHPLQATPRWQWDVRARTLRLYFPRQTLVSSAPPATLVIKKEQYPIRAKFGNGVWQLEPIVLASLPVDWPDPVRFKAELLGIDGICLRRWQIEPPSGGALFFRTNQSGLLAVYQDGQKGLLAGEYLVLLRRGLRLEQETGEIKVKYRERLPQGFAEYQAECMDLQPPLGIFALGDEKEWLQRIPLLAEAPCMLRLEGDLLEQADDPSGAPVYKGNAPELRIPAQTFDEVKFLQLHVRELSTAEGGITDLHSMQNLVAAEIGVWSEAKCELRVQLDNLLLSRTYGRFRLKLLQGLQSARYQPVEFSLTPPLRITPNREVFAQTLFDLCNPPRAELIGPEIGQISSLDGEVKVVMPGFYEVHWLGQQNEFTALLNYGQFQIPLRWRPHVLRMRLAFSNTTPQWLTEPLRLTSDELSFERELVIEGIEGAEYHFFANETCVLKGRFDAQECLRFPLARFKDSVKACEGHAVLLRIVVGFCQRFQHLPIAQVVKNSVGRAKVEIGELLVYLRAGQQVLHPNYGLGLLETFVDECVAGEEINLARFHFYRHEGVTVYIPSTRRLPLYGGGRTLDVLKSDQAASPRIRVFTVKPTCEQIEPAVTESHL
jgi:hypothetical protein